MLNKLIGFVLTLWMFGLCEAYNVLVVFPVPGKSHSILGDMFVKHLLNADYQVTYITPDPMESNDTRLRQINVGSDQNGFLVDFLDIQKLTTRETDMKDMSTVYTLMFNRANATIHHENVQKLIQDTTEVFDAVVAEWMYSELYSGFAAVFDCPLIFFLSVSPHSMALPLIDSDLNPAYTADHIRSNSIPPFSFWNRVEELGIFLNWKIYRWWVNDLNCMSYNTAFTTAVNKRGRELTPLDVLKYNASLMFANSHISTADGIALPRNVIEIGGYHINDTVEPLPKDLQDLMDRAEDGVIFFSMGSMLRSSKMPKEIKSGILKIFGQLNQTVIWKLEENLHDTPKNVHIIHWAPQQSILAHPNCILFITHGGLLSTTEALHNKVPVIGVPIFADQYININRAVAKGIGLRVDFDNNIASNLKIAIEYIINNSTFHERINELNYIYHDRTLSPGEEIPRWVGHVIKTRGAPHLRSPALLVTWYQKLYLDLILFLAFFLVTLCIVSRRYVCKKHSVSLSKKRI